MDSLVYVLKSGNDLNHSHIFINELFKKETLLPSPYTPMAGQVYILASGHGGLMDPLVAL